MKPFLLLLYTLFLSFPAPLVAGDDWDTYYEKSQYLRTPRYAETMDYCKRLDSASPWITLTSFGKSGQGRDLPLIIVDKDGLTEPEAIHRTGRVVVLLQACIHAGECEGKDAGLMLVRDLVIRKQYPGMLNHISLVFIPIFNVDGHERFGPFNRINQNGPEEMGWRVTATNLNLNRDYLKADTPEMQAWLSMFDRWMPDFFIDTHTTDGADYQYALTYLMETFGDMDEGLTRWASSAFIPAMEHRMDSTGYLVFPYVEFREWHDPKSGLTCEVSPPLLSQAYTSLRNRPGFLIETHMLKSYQVRVNATYECVLSCLKVLSTQVETLKNLIRAADQSVSSPAFLHQKFPLKFRLDNTDSTLVEFKGISYAQETSPVTGGTWYRYGHTPETMKIPYFTHNIPEVTVQLPKAYIIPVQWQSVISKLALHGIRTRTLKSPVKVTIHAYRFRSPKWQSSPYEGRHPLVQFSLEEVSEEREFPAGSVIAETCQPSARILAQLLEPNGNGSLAYWGFFDATFEQKEYAETYVLEPMAAKMLADDPKLKAEFEQKKASDSVFAHNPDAELNWFYLHSPYMDPNRYLYPVGRIMDEGTLRLAEQKCSP